MMKSGHSIARLISRPITTNQTPSAKTRMPATHQPTETAAPNSATTANEISAIHARHENATRSNNFDGRDELIKNS